MLLTLDLILRILKNSKKFSFIFILNFTLGILGLFSLEYFQSMMQTSLYSRAKSLLGSDLSIQSNFPITEWDMTRIQSHLPAVKKWHRGVSVTSMASSAKNSRLVQVIKISPGFPYYGGLKLASGHHFPQQKVIPKHNEIWIYPAVMAQLGVSKGEKIKVGAAYFKINGIIEEDSFKAIRLSGFLPRIYMSEEAMTKAKLNTPGSTTRHSLNYLFQENYTIDQLEQIEENLEETIGGSIRVQSPKDSSNRVSRLMRLMTDFLSLVSLVSLFLSFVGLFYLYSSFLHKFQSDIHILHQIGLRKTKVSCIFLGHFFILVFSAFILTLVIVQFCSPWAIKLLQSQFGLYSNYKVDPWLYFKSLVFLLGMTPTIALPMLRQFSYRDKKRGWRFAFNYIPLCVVMIVLAQYVVQTNNLGLYFSISIFFFSFIFFFISIAVFKRLDSSGLHSHLLPSLIVKSLMRQPSQSLSLGLSLMLSVALFSLVSQVSQSLIQNIALTKDEKPRYFLIDIQPEQRDPLKQFLLKSQAQLQNLSPFIRARIVGINEQFFDLESDQETKNLSKEQIRLRERAVNLSYRNYMYSSEKILQGEAFKKEYTDQHFKDSVELSIESRYAKQLGLQLGDSLHFDVLGIQFPAKIKNIRSVKWTDFLPNFFLLLQDGALNNAPQTYIATIPHGQYSGDELILQLAEKFPNITAIDIQSVIDQILKLIHTTIKVLDKMLILSFGLGLLMMSIIIHQQMILRFQNMQFFKSVGMRLKQIFSLQVLEFAFLSILTTSLGLCLSTVGSWWLSQFLFDGIWSFQTNILIATGLSIPLYTIVLVSTLSFFQLQKRETQLFRK